MRRLFSPDIVLKDRRLQVIK